MKLAKLLILLLFPCALFAQTHTFPATDTNNAFTGVNTFPNINNILYVDGTKYATLGAALAACVSPGCVVYDNISETWGTNPFASLPSGVYAEVHLARQTWIANTQILVPNKSQLIGSGRGDANSTGTVIQAGASFPSSTAILEMGATPIAVAVRIENLTVDCNNKVGAIGIQNFWSQEQSGINHVLMANCPANGLDVETSSAQSSGPYQDIESLNQSTCTNCSASTVPIVVKNVGVFRGIHGATINSMGAAAPNVGMQIDTQGTFENIHFEYVTAGLVIGSQQATSGVFASNIECGPSTTNCVVFSNAYSSQNLSADSISASTGNLIEDLINSHTLVASTEGGSVAFYAIGNGTTQPILTSSVSLPNLFGAVTIPSITGTQCVHAVSGVLTGTGSDCGTGSGSIGGSGTANYYSKFTGPTTIGNGTLQDNGSAALIPENLAIQGPDPFIDIAGFMPVGGCSEVTGAAPTATVMASSTSVALTGFYAGFFYPGCGVMIEKAGPTSTIAAPTGLAATSHGTGGSTTIKYSMVAIDNSEGYSPASTTLTFTTSDTYANLTTHHYNFIKGSAVTGAVMYCTYSDKGTGGSQVAIGCDTQPTFRDQGANHNFNGSTTFPPTFLPTNPPGSNGPQALFTTVVTAGSSTWTIANAASNTATSVNVYHDISGFVNDVTAVLQNYSSGHGYNGRYATILCPAGNYTMARWPLGTAVSVSFQQVCALNNVNLPWPIYQVTWDGSLSSGQPGNFQTSNKSSINMSNTSSDVFSTIYSVYIKNTNVNNLVGPAVRMSEGGSITLDGNGFNNLAASNNCSVIGDGNVIPGIFSNNVFTAGTGANADGSMCWSDQTAGNTSDISFSNNWFIERGIWADNPGRSSQSVIGGGCTGCQTENNLDNGIINADSGTSVENTTIGAFYFSGSSQDNTRNSSINFASIFCNNPENVGARCTTQVFDSARGSDNSVRLSNPGTSNLTAGGFYTQGGEGAFASSTWNVGSGVGGSQTNIGQSSALFPANVAILGPGGNGDVGYSALLPPPYLSALVPTGTGGTLPAGTYYYVVTAMDSIGGESAIGPERSATTTGSTSEISMTASSNMGYQISCIRVYRGTSPGMETGYIGAVTVNGSSCTAAMGNTSAGYVDTNSVSLTTATPPTNSSAYWMRTPTDQNYTMFFGIEGDTGGTANGLHKPFGHGTACTNCEANGIGFDEEDGTIKAGKGLTTTQLQTVTKCAANGTAASPSVVSCSGAPSGTFSCATNASTATCVVNSTIITANSAIFIQPSAAAGTLLSVTCNTTADTGLTAPRLASISAGTSFTINLGTFSTNPVCFNYFVVN